MLLDSLGWLIPVLSVGLHQPCMPGESWTLPGAEELYEVGSHLRVPMCAGHVRVVCWVYRGEEGRLKSREEAVCCPQAVLSDHAHSCHPLEPALTDGHCCWSSQGRLCHLQEEVDRKSSHRRKEDSEAQAWMQHNFNECKEEKEVAHREHQGQPPRCGAAPAGCPSACPSQGGREAKRSPLGWSGRCRQERK